MGKELVYEKAITVKLTLSQYDYLCSFALQRKTEVSCIIRAMIDNLDKTEEGLQEHIAYYSYLTETYKTKLEEVRMKKVKELNDKVSENEQCQDSPDNLSQVFSLVVWRPIMNKYGDILLKNEDGPMKKQAVQNAVEMFKVCVNNLDENVKKTIENKFINYFKKYCYFDIKIDP